MIAENEPQDNEFEDAKLLNASALARCLSVSLRQAHRMNRSGLIPRPLRIGRCVRWRADEISRWLRCGAPARDQWETMRAEKQATVTFVLRNLQGEEVRLDIYRGKPLLLYFWATW